MPPQARTPPADHPVFIWPTPEEQDLLFYVERDGRLPKYQSWTYGTAHDDATVYPNHKLVHVSPQDGKNWSRWYYAADRISEDAYNWEYRQADLGGRKFDGVRRTYLTPRADFSASSPAAGAAMPDTPAGLFSGYILATREQRRTGDAIFDSLYVIEIRDYVVRVTITAQKLDPAFGSPLASSETLYYTGEIYTGAIPIETAALSSTYWGLSNAGVNTEVQRLTANWYLVTSQDVIPQLGVGIDTYGYLLRSYETWRDFSWPAVISPTSFNFTSIDRKNGSSSTTVRIKPDRGPYDGPTRFKIQVYWQKSANTGLTTPIVFDVQSKSYSGAQYSVGFRNMLVSSGIALIDTIGTQDPVFEQAAYGDAAWALASNQTDWPVTTVNPAVFAISQAPYRGGFLTTVTSAWRPV